MATRTARATLAALAAVTALPLSARPAQAPQVFGVDARLVAVPVFVTDEDGRPVLGLTAEDFEIEDQGRPAAVAGFLTVDVGDDADRSVPARALAAASRRQFLLLFDLTFSTPSGIGKAQQAALEILQRGFADGDLVAVASVGPGGVRIPIGFTSDRFQAAQAVANLGGAEGERLRDPLALAYDMGIPLAETSGSFGLLLQPSEKMGGKVDMAAALRDQLLQVARAERDAYRQRVTAYVSELQRLAQLLDALEGRKQVVLLSTGFDQTVLLGAQRAEQVESARAVTEGRIWEVQGDRHFGDSTARTALDAVYNALARSDTVIHTVDVGGLAAGPPGSLDEMGGESRGSGKETLAQVAGRSGGRFVRESNDLSAALREVVDASGTYYVLAFEPREGGKAGQLRKLRIKVKRPGTQVSHRAGYVLRDPKAVDPPPTLAMDAAETIAKGLSGGAIRLHAVAMPYRGAGGRLTLPVVLQVDGGTLLAAGGTRPMRLEIFGYAFDANGRVQDAIGLTPTLDLAQVGGAVRDKGVQVLTAFRVAEGPADLRFLVRDGAGGRSGSLRLRTEVPAFAPATLVLSAPLVMDDPRARVVIPTASQANANLEIPFRVGETAFTPDAAPVLRNGAPREICVLASGALPGSPTVRAALLRADGSSTPLDISPARVVADADSLRRVVATVTPRGVAPGEYRLRLTVPDVAGTDVHTEAAVQVLP